MTACGWVDWCAREGEIEVELSNRAGTERMLVCRLHVGAARLYGYRDLGSDDPAGPDDDHADPGPDPREAGGDAGE